MWENWNQKNMRVCVCVYRLSSNKFEATAKNINTLQKAET